MNWRLLVGIAATLLSSDAIAQRPTSVFGGKKPTAWELTFSEDNFFANHSNTNQTEVGLFAEDNHGLTRVIDVLSTNDFDKLSMGARFFSSNDAIEIKPALVLQKSKDFTHYATGLYGTIRSNAFSDWYTRLRLVFEIHDFDDINKAGFVNLTQKTPLNLDLLLMGSLKTNGNTVGIGSFVYLPQEFYVMYGFAKDEKTKQMVGIGRYVPFGPENFASFFFTHKFYENYRFSLGGIGIGGSELVKPALIGMTEGAFFSYGAFTENNQVRRMEQLGEFSKDFEIADFVLLYANQNITIPAFGTELHQGFGEVIGYYNISSNLYVVGAIDWLKNAVFSPFNPGTHETQFTTGGIGFRMHKFDRIIGIELTGEVEKGKFRSVNAGLYLPL